VLARKRRWYVWLLVIALVISVTACSQSPAEEPEPAETGTESEEPSKVGGKLTIGLTRDGFTNLDASVTNSRYDGHFISNIYDPLIWQLEPGEYRPGLATDWEYNDDYTKFRVTLREDVVLHDGTKFNADLLVWNVEHILDPDVGSYATALFNDMVRNEAVSEYVWEIEFSEPQYRFMDTLAGYRLSPNSPSAYEELGSEYGTAPVSTGPYMVDSWPDEMTMVLKRNPNWVKPDWMDESWGPFLEEIIVKFIPEKETASVALERGELQMVFNPPFHDVPGFESSGDYSIHKHFTAGLPQGLNINVSKAPTNDLALRKALFFATNKEEINQLVWFGVFQPAYSVLASTSWAYWDGAKDMYPFDPEKARQTLEEGGWAINSETGFYEKDGQEALVRIVTTGGKQHEIVESRWQEIDLNANLEAMAYEATEARYAANDYEVARLGLSGFDPAGPLRGAFHSENCDAGSQFNRSKVKDPHIDNLLAEGEKLFNMDERREIYIEAQEYIMDQALFLPLWEDAYVWVLNENFQGFEFNVRGDPMLHKAWLSE